MSLNAESKKSAQAFGAALKETQPVQRYLQAQAALEADPEIYAKEQHMQAMYADLATRQKVGESLARAEVDEFNTLRGEVIAHPLVVARDDALADVKTLFADAASLLSAPLEMDYTSLAAH